MYLFINYCSEKHLSGKQLINKRKVITIVLTASFELLDHSKTHYYKMVVAHVGDHTVTKSHVIRALKKASPGVYIRRGRKDNTNQYPFH